MIETDESIMNGGLYMIKMAIMYDFDKTLSPKNMQEFSFLQSIGFDDPNEFWKQCSHVAKTHKMDSNLAYMYLMLQKSNACDKPIRREDFVQLGKDVELYPGVESWFDRIRKYGEERGIEVEHYIISSGLSEIIEGTSIYPDFKKVYACKYYYNASGMASWPAMVVNYTTKTQYIYRINKGVLDESNDFDLNRSTPESAKAIPFSRMVYIGDGFTDVPSMKLVNTSGGYAIAVYGEEEEVAKTLIEEKRANFIAPADYSENSKLDQIMKGIIDLIEKRYRLSVLEEV